MIYKEKIAIWGEIPTQMAGKWNLRCNCSQADFLQQYKVAHTEQQAHPCGYILCLDGERPSALRRVAPGDRHGKDIMMAKANERLNELLRIKPFPPLRTEGLREGLALPL